MQHPLAIRPGRFRHRERLIRPRPYLPQRPVEIAVRLSSMRDQIVINDRALALLEPEARRLGRLGRDRMKVLHHHFLVELGVGRRFKRADGRSGLGLERGEHGLGVAAGGDAVRGPTARVGKDEPLDAIDWWRRCRLLLARRLREVCVVLAEPIVAGR